MNKKILVPVGIAVVALVAIFILAINGLTVPPKKVAKAPEHKGPMQQQVAAADFETILTAEKNKLHPQVQGEIGILEEALKDATTDVEKSAVYETIGKKWIDIKKPAMGAYYFAQSGILDYSEKKLTFASHLFNEALHDESRPEIRQWMGETAEKALRKVLEKDEHNVEAKMELATLYIEGLGQPMQGIAQLQEIVKNDSSNFKANLVMGRMAIESNQLDKAIDRANLILRYHPDSWEANVLLAEVHIRQGQKDSAMKYLNEAKKHNKNPEFIKDVDQYINSIK